MENQKTNQEYNPAYPLSKGFNAIPVQDAHPVSAEKKKTALDCLHAMIQKAKNDLKETQ